MHRGGEPCGELHACSYPHVIAQVWTDFPSPGSGHPRPASGFTMLSTAGDRPGYDGPTGQPSFRPSCGQHPPHPPHAESRRVVARVGAYGDAARIGGCRSSGSFTASGRRMPRGDTENAFPRAAGADGTVLVRAHVPARPSGPQGPLLRAHSGRLRPRGVRALCRDWGSRADRYRASKSALAFGPGGRQAQRAYHDAVRDLVVPAMGIRGGRRGRRGSVRTRARAAGAVAALSRARTPAPATGADSRRGQASWTTRAVVRAAMRTVTAARPATWTRVREGPRGA